MNRVSRKEMIAGRRKKILQILSSSENGQAGYSTLEKKLNQQGYEVGERTVRQDCKHLFDRGLALKIRKGAAITSKGNDLLFARNISVDDEIKTSYLKQMAILKLLYDHAMRVFRAPSQGMLAREIATRQGIGSEDTVRDILKKMAREGLVKQENGRWSLGSGFPRPVPVDGETARRLYEHLNTVSALVSLPPELDVLKSKLAPLMIINGRDMWREKLAKTIERIMVHGRGIEENSDMLRVLALVEEAIYARRVIEGEYRGRKLKLHPLGVVYHWEKGQWYIIARNPRQKAVMTYRLSRFSSVQAVDESFERPAGFDLNQYLEKRWGISSDQELDVGVRFSNTAWHPVALDKLRAGVSRRRICCEHCQLEEFEDGTIILRDRVAGLSEFETWVRSYGDAAEILYPDRLKKLLARTGRRMLARYCPGGEKCE